MLLQCPPPPCTWRLFRILIVGPFSYKKGCWILAALRCVSVGMENLRSSWKKRVAVDHTQSEWAWTMLCFQQWWIWIVNRSGCLLLLARTNYCANLESCMKLPLLTKYADLSTTCTLKKKYVALRTVLLLKSTLSEEGKLCEFYKKRVVLSRVVRCSLSIRVQIVHLQIPSMTKMQCSSGAWKSRSIRNTKSCVEHTKRFSCKLNWNVILDYSFCDRRCASHDKKSTEFLFRKQEFPRKSAVL